MTLTDTTLYWLAGLLEGEGYFGTVNQRKGGRLYRYARVGVNMTDRDVIERVAALWGVKVYVMKVSGVSKLVGYRVTIIGTHAIEIMCLLRPLMGSRRQAQIDKALREFEAKPDTNESRKLLCKEVADKRWAKHRSANAHVQTENQ